MKDNISNVILVYDDGYQECLDSSQSKKLLEKINHDNYEWTKMRDTHDKEREKWNKN